MTSEWLDRIVEHSEYGRGRIIDVRNAGFEVQVAFASRSRPLWMRRDRLTVVGAVIPKDPAPPDPPIAGPDVPPRPPQTPRSERFADRKVVEALRLGIVPDDGLALFTEGRENEVAALRTWMAQDGVGAHAVIGSYGSGKTHLLRYVVEDALNDGFAVSFVSVNPSDLSFSKPKRVYAEIVRSLRWRSQGETLGFRSLVMRGIDCGLLNSHEYFKILRKTSPAEMWEWVEGRTGSSKPVFPTASWEHFPGLYDNMKTANIYTYLITSLGALVAEPRLGGKGLLVVFDESESLNIAYTRRSWEMGLNFVNALIASTNGDPKLAQSPALHSTWHGLEFSGLAASLPFLYRAPSHTKCLFAFTSEDILELSPWIAGMGRTELNPLDYDAQRKLKSRLTDVYLRAYGAAVDDINWQRSRNVSFAFDDNLTRYLVKMHIELMDLSRFGI